MSNKAVYRVIAKDNNKVVQYRKAHDVAIFMLGRRIDAYLLIKSDLRGDRVITLTNPEINAIEKQLDEG